MNPFFKSQQGQALLEVAVSLVLFATLLYGLDYLASAVVIRNRALSYQHHLLTQAYREAESCDTAMAPPPPDVRVKWLGDHESRKKHLRGADYLSIKPGQYVLSHTFIPNFSSQSHALLNTGAKTFSFSAHTFRDPWHDNKLYVAALWAYALGRALGGGDNQAMQNNTEKVSSTNLGPGAKGGQQQTVSQFQLFSAGNPGQGADILSRFQSPGFSSEESNALQSNMGRMLQALQNAAASPEAL